MRWAYVDSSIVVATLLKDAPPSKLNKAWKSADRFISSYLLESEVLSSAKREGIDLNLAKAEISRLGFVRTPSLLNEALEILKVSYIRGADLFHLATAMWVKNKHSGLKFLSLDERQLEIAEKFGF